VKIFLDGDAELPTMAGTGTEDYVGTAWGQGQYAHLYQGSPIADEGRMQWAFYRYHVPDPVWFRKDVRVTVQQIGFLADHRRANVALTRARRGLFVVGDGATLSADGFYAALWEHCEKAGALRSAYELM
jgi:hypothetical protein